MRHGRLKEGSGVIDRSSLHSLVDRTRRGVSPNWIRGCGDLDYEGNTSSCTRNQGEEGYSFNFGQVDLENRVLAEALPKTQTHSDKFNINLRENKITNLSE